MNETVDQMAKIIEVSKNNITLSDKEVKIVLIKYIIHGTSPYAEASIETRVQMLKVAAAQFGLVYDDDEWQKIGMEILAVQQRVNDNAAKFLNSNSDLYKSVMSGIKNGNDALIKVVDGAIEGGLKKLGLVK